MIKTRDELAEEILSYHGCVSGDCPHEDQMDCYKSLIKHSLLAGHDARNSEVEALKKKIKEIENES